MFYQFLNYGNKLGPTDAFEVILTFHIAGIGGMYHILSDPDILVAALYHKKVSLKKKTLFFLAI